MSFEIIKGSCVDQNVDVIVNAANCYLQMGDGVCGAIFEKAGVYELQQECNDRFLPVSVSDAVITGAYEIRNAKAIIHAVGPDFRCEDRKADFASLYRAYLNSLNVMKKNGYHSIAFPLISSGVYAGNMTNPAGLSALMAKTAYDHFVTENKGYEVEMLLCAFTDREFINASNAVFFIDASNAVFSAKS